MKVIMPALASIVRLLAANAFTLFVLTVPADGKVMLPDPPAPMVKPPNWTFEVVVMFWTKLIAPLLAVKLVLLNEAIPLAVVLALSRVMVVPEVVEFDKVRAPAIAAPLVAPWIDSTPLPAAANPQPAVSPSRQIMPVWLGIVTVVLAPGNAKASVLVKPLSLAARVVEALPCKARRRLVAPTVRLPPGLMANAPALWMVVALMVLAVSGTPTVTVEPSSVILESATVLALVNLTRVLVVPGLLVLTVVAPPEQLARVSRQTVSLVPPAIVGTV